MKLLRAALPVLITAVVLGGCEDNLTGPGEWIAFTDSVTVYSAARPEYVGRPAAFDFTQGTVFSLEAPPVVTPSGTVSQGAGGYDFVLSEQAGALVLVPSGVVENRTTGAGVADAPASESFEQVAEAPRDSAQYRSTSATPLQLNQIYIVRSRTAQCTSITTGAFYAKLQVIALDPARGTASFRFVRNPYCEDRALIPPEIDDL